MIISSLFDLSFDLSFFDTTETTAKNSAGAKKARRRVDIFAFFEINIADKTQLHYSDVLVLTKKATSQRYPSFIGNEFKKQFRQESVSQELLAAGSARMMETEFVDRIHRKQFFSRSATVHALLHARGWQQTKNSQIKTAVLTAYQSITAVIAAPLRIALDRLPLASKPNNLLTWKYEIKHEICYH